MNKCNEIPYNSVFWLPCNEGLKFVTMSPNKAFFPH